MHPTSALQDLSCSRPGVQPHMHACAHTRAGWRFSPWSLPAAAAGPLTLNLLGICHRRTQHGARKVVGVPARAERAYNRHERRTQLPHRHDAVGVGDELILLDADHGQGARRQPGGPEIRGPTNTGMEGGQSFRCVPARAGFMNMRGANVLIWFISCVDGRQPTAAKAASAEGAGYSALARAVWTPERTSGRWVS